MEITLSDRVFSLLITEWADHARFDNPSLPSHEFIPDAYSELETILKTINRDIYQKSTES